MKIQIVDDLSSNASSMEYRMVLLCEEQNLEPLYVEMEIHYEPRIDCDGHFDGIKDWEVYDCQSLQLEDPEDDQSELLVKGEYKPSDALLDELLGEMLPTLKKDIEAYVHELKVDSDESLAEERYYDRMHYHD